MDLDNLYPKWNCPICSDWFHMPYKFCKCDKRETMESNAVSQKVTVKLDKKGRFKIEALRPILAEKTDTISFYEIEKTDSGDVVLKLFDKEGNKI